MPLIRPILYQWVISEGSESPKIPHKLVLSENASISALFTVILGEMDPKGEKLVNLAKNRFTSQFRLKYGTLKMGVVIFLKSTIAQSTTNLQLQASLEYILMKNLMVIF